MAIAVRSYSTATFVGNVDSTATPGSQILMPSGLAVGDYLVIGVFFAQELGNSTVVVPTGFTQLTANGTSSNRMFVTYGMAITDSTVLSSVSGGVYLRAAATATRVVAIAAALTGVAGFSSAATLNYTNAAASSVTYNPPATGDTKFYFVVTNSSSPSTSPAHTSVGGSKVVQAVSPSATGPTFSDSQISLMIGGTGATFAASVANSGSVGFGLTASANQPPVASFTTATSSLTLTVNATGSTDSDGTISTYAWDFGDSTTTTGVTPAAHTYAIAGTYTVGLTVTDNGGLTNTLTKSVTVPTVLAPTRVGYSITNPFTASATMILDPSVVTGGAAIATGDWMIAAIATYNGSTLITPPSGWTTLKGFEGPGTLRYAVFGKIRVGADTSYTFTTDVGGASAAGVLMWGVGADSNFSNWIIGATTNRSVDLHNTGVSVTTTVDHSLILGLSFERTTVSESAITSLTGATEWLFLPQFSTTQLETVDIAYVADKTPAGATTAMEWVYPNSQATNGAAFQIAIPPAPTSTNIAVGYPAVLRQSSTNYSGKLFYWDGTAAHDFTTTPIVTFNPVTVTQFLSSQHAPWFSAHRGFSYSYPEESLYSYRSATDWGIKAIEISIQKSQDGTFWCFHDATTTRTTGVTGTIASMTDATLAVLTNVGTTAAGNPSQPARPVAKLVDVLNVYAATHVIIIEDKTYANTTAVLNLMDSYGTIGRPATEIFIWKVDGTAGTGFYTSAATRGYHRWAYIFDNNMGAPFTSLVTSGKADLIGMDFNSSDATLTPAIAACIANSIMPTAHIVSSSTQRDRLIGLGMKGIMISNKDIVPPWYTLWSN